MVECYALLISDFSEKFMCVTSNLGVNVFLNVNSVDLPNKSF